jgi:transposase
MKKYSQSREFVSKGFGPNEFVALDVHKRYSLMERENRDSGEVHRRRIEHQAGAIKEALKGIAPGTAVAVEATGNWYWIINEIEQRGLQPLLVHPYKAKLMMGETNKTDALDVHGLNRLQRTGTLPTVWIPPGEIRDLREVTRMRMALSAQRTQVKNRIHAALGKYALQIEASDIFGRKARQQLDELVLQLPEQTAWVVQQELLLLDGLQQLLKSHEKRIKDLLQVTPEMQRLSSLPGVGPLLAAVLAFEIGDVKRFGRAEKLASYAGTTPRVHASGGKVRNGQLRSDVNHYLKWGFAEAGNSVAVNHKRCPQLHVSKLYWRLRQKKGHATAVGAVARHLAEAAYYVLSREEEYKERGARTEAKKTSALAPH